MDNASITTEILLEELLAALDLKPEPSQDNGWFTIEDMMNATGQSEDTVRDHAAKKVKAGKIEKTRWNGKVYFRKVEHD